MPLIRNRRDADPLTYSGENVRTNAQRGHPLMRFTAPSTGDIVAGVSVALVALPQSLAYAELAGMPPQYGLFASALPSLLAALFVSSRYLQTGPVALTALLTFGALSGLQEPATADYIELAALLALLVGVVRVLLGFLRLGSVAYLLSEPVLAGFTTGAAILIVSSQIPRTLGVTRGDDGVLTEAAKAITDVGAWHWSLGAVRRRHRCGHPPGPPHPQPSSPACSSRSSPPCC